MPAESTKVPFNKSSCLRKSLLQLQKDEALFELDSSPSPSLNAESPKTVRFSESLEQVKIIPSRGSSGLGDDCNTEENRKGNESDRTVLLTQETTPPIPFHFFLFVNSPQQVLDRLKETLELRSKGVFSRFNELLEFLDVLSTAMSEDHNSKESFFTKLIAGQNSIGEIPQKMDLFAWMMDGFSALISELNHSTHQQLVLTLIEMPWIHLSCRGIKSFSGFLRNLVSAHSATLNDVCDMLLGHFNRLDYEDDETAILSPLHRTFRGILSLVPTGPSFLVPLISSNFPRKEDDVVSHSCFTKNLIVLMSYCSILRQSLYFLIIDKLVQFDMDIQLEVDEIGVEHEVIESLDHQPFFADENDQVSPSGDSGSDSDFSESSFAENDDDDEIFEADFEIISADDRVMCVKLDALMRIMFLSLEKSTDPAICGDSGILDFHEMMFEVFERTILSTHRLKFTQYLWFRLCYLDNSFSEKFVGLLMQKVFDSSQAHVVRVSAASYIGSFLARAKFLTLPYLRSCLRCLNRFAKRYVESSAFINIQPDITKHSVFYAVVQAIIYVFCFKWRELMEECIVAGHQPNFPAELKGFQQVLLSKFSPLRVCSEGIVSEFARITHDLDIMYCFPLMERTRSSDSYANRSKSEHSNDLSLLVLERMEAFFPFDPFTLPQSRSFIDDIYLSWDSSHGEDSDVSEHLSDLEDAAHEDSDGIGRFIPINGGGDDDADESTSLQSHSMQSVIHYDDI